MKTLSFSVPSHEKKVSIFLGEGLLNDRAFLKTILNGLDQRIALIADSHVAPLFGEPLEALLQEIGYAAHLLTFPAGEQSKSRAIKESLEDRLFEKGFSRDSVLIALGGGVTSDLGGFLAATFCRGIPLINVPTSFLGMVDASIGGKTGLNTPYGKNLIGAIYQPQSILIDVETLKRLPLKEYREGIAECIKYGAVLDEALFALLEGNVDAILAKDPSLLKKLIEESVRIKGQIVSSDEQETGKRRLLNFGHTLGHAFESLSHYQISHGDAVALGMSLESRFFLESGFMDLFSYERLIKVIAAYGFSLEIPSFSLDEIVKSMGMDKKALNGTPRFVGISSIGEPLSFGGIYCVDIPLSIIKKSIS